MLAREVVLKCQSPERSSAKRIAAFHRTMTHTRVHAKQKKVEQKRKIIHLLQECKATVVKNPRIAIYVTNNSIATSLANKKKKAGDKTLSISLFLRRCFIYPASHTVPQNKRKSSAEKLKFFCWWQMRETKERGKDEHAPTKKISCLGVGLFLPGCTSRVLSQCRVESSRSNQCLHARSGTP